MPQTEPVLRNIVQQQLLRCSPATPVAEAARRMVEARCSSILIEDEGRITGIWTEHDALALGAGDPGDYQRPIGAVMSAPVKSLSADTTLGAAALRFREENVRHFLVVDDGSRQLGIISQSDVVANQGMEYYISLREVRSVFSRRLLIIPGTLSAAAAIGEMRLGGFDAIVVEDSSGEYGILTERDVLRLIGNGQPDRAVAGIATFPLIRIPASASLYQARKQFVAHSIRHLGVSGADGELLGLITFADILANIELDYVRQLKETLHEREELLAQSNRKLRLAARAFDSTFEGILVTNAEQTIESVNPAFSMITGYRADEVIGRKPSILASGRHDADFYAAMHSALKLDGHWQGEVWNRRRTGELYVEWLTINVVKDDQGKVSNYVAVFSDITSRKAAEERMSFLAQHDALTGLPNRILLSDRLLRAMAHAQRNNRKLALIFLDLDDFKLVNDNIGHHAGDQVLQVVAQRLLGCVRLEDTVARLGGDEFVVVIEELSDEAHAREIAAKFLAALAQPFPVDGHDISVHVSIGISFYPDHGNSAEVLLRRADAAMYQAKAQGSDHVNIAA